MSTSVWKVEIPRVETINDFMDIFTWTRKQELPGLGHPDIGMLAAFACYVLERQRQSGGLSGNRPEWMWKAATGSGHKWFKGKNKDNYLRGGHNLLRRWLLLRYGNGAIPTGSQAQLLYTSFWDHFDGTAYRMLYDELEAIGLKPDRSEWGL